MAVSDVPTADLAALAQALSYWTTSPGFDARWDTSGTEDPEHPSATLRGAMARATRWAEPAVAALEAVTEARERLAKAEAALALLASQGALKRALELVPDDDRLLSVHDEEATPGRYAEAVVRALGAP